MDIGWETDGDKEKYYTREELEQKKAAAEKQKLVQKQ